MDKPDIVWLPERTIRARTRRDFLLFGAGTAAALVGFWGLLPDGAFEDDLPAGAVHALDTAAARMGLTKSRRERILNRGLTFDDDVAEALYSKTRSVRTYSRGQVTPLRNNYNGATPSAEYLSKWSLTLDGLASGKPVTLTMADLIGKFMLYAQVTRLVCVEGWSAVAWWAGVRFADFLAAYPPAPNARWAGLESGVNLDAQGNEDPYYVSIDLETARHPQTLLATHLGGRPLTVEHGAPLRLLAPMKLGLKNIKAITEITYSAEQPDDYWAKRGYSKYDGL
jgi:DMSO/TMAO reductase YedYZ molybdopterin-dependent catalytic subunit